MQPEQQVARQVHRVALRARAADVLRATVAAATCATILAVVLAFTTLSRAPVWTIASAAGLTLGLLMVWRRRAGRSHAAAALRVERRFPELRNLLVTAHELTVHPERASDWMRGHVLTQAADAIAGLDLRAAVPLQRPALFAVLAMTLLLVTAGGLDRQARQVVSRVAERVTSSRALGAGHVRIVAELVPPAYLRSPSARLVDPERIEAIEGTVLRMTVRGTPRAVRFGSRTFELRRDADSASLDFRLDRSGYIAIEPGAGAAETAPILIPIVIRPDAAPAVTIEAPGRDLLLPDASSSLSVTAAAADDHELAALELKYTKVSGGGELFEFEEGTLPLVVARESGRSWRGRANVALSDLKLDAGDALVYRAVARDNRPGSPPSSSDTFYIEIQGPGQVPLDSVALPPDQERYALSQQMVVLKIERLRARERDLTRDAVAEESATIAAEQRLVRANFIFLMGGHVEDEEVEAEQSHEIQEGRLENSARRDITTAIRHMTRAEQGLTAVNTGAALPPARAAVEALQRAFGRNRYILRTMPVRSRIDPSRRLTGDFSAAAGWKRDVATPVLDREVRESRALLVDLFALAARSHDGRGIDANQVAALGERALAIDPASPRWQDVATRIGAAADAVRGKLPANEVTARLGGAITPVAAAARQHALSAAGASSAPLSRLESAWAEGRR